MMTKDGKIVDEKAKYPNAFVRFFTAKEFEDPADRYFDCYKRIMEALRYEGVMEMDWALCTVEFLRLFSRPFHHFEFMQLAHKWVTIW